MLSISLLNWNLRISMSEMRMGTASVTPDFLTVTNYRNTFDLE